MIREAMLEDGGSPVRSFEDTHQGHGQVGFCVSRDVALLFRSQMLTILIVEVVDV